MALAEDRAADAVAVGGGDREVFTAAVLVGVEEMCCLCGF